MFEYKIDGPGLKDGVPIHIASSALDNFQSIVDKTFLVSIGSKRLSAKDRERFQLKATRFENGSFLTYFDIVLAGVQLTLPFAGTLGPQNIWSFTKDSFAFLKLVCESVQNDEKPTYEYKNNGDVKVRTGDTINHFHGPVIQIGELSLPSYQALAYLIDPQKLDHISAGPTKHKEPDIFIGKDDKHIFDIPTRIEKESVKLDCEIFDFNKYKNIGKLSIKDKNQVIPTGQYNFMISGSQNSIDYIYSMLELSVTVICNVEMESNPFGGDDKVHKLHIIGVDS